MLFIFLNNKIIRMKHLTADNPKTYNPETTTMFQERGLFADMKVKIRTRELCPDCGKAFVLSVKGLVCVKHQRYARKFYLDWFFHGERFTLYGFDSFKEAYNKSSSIEDEIANFRFKPEKYLGVNKSITKKHSFSTLYDKWITLKEKDTERNLMSPSYLRKIKEYKEKYNNPNNGFCSEDVRIINKGRIADFVAGLPKEHSQKTIKNILTVLSSFYSYLIDNEIVYEKPRFPKIKVPKKQVKWLSREDQIKAFDALPNEHKAIFLFMFQTGCRPAEARALLWDDIDQKNMTVTIRHNFSEEQHRNITKGKKERTIPITNDVYQMLQGQPKLLRSDFVFHIQGHPYGDNLNRIWQRACKLVGIKGITCYEGTRHSFASQLVNKGVSLAIIGEFLGHADKATTDKYAHVNMKGMRGALETD